MPDNGCRSGKTQRSGLNITQAHTLMHTLIHANASLIRLHSYNTNKSASGHHVSMRPTANNPTNINIPLTPSQTFPRFRRFVETPAVISSWNYCKKGIKFNVLIKHQDTLCICSICLWMPVLFSAEEICTTLFFYMTPPSPQKTNKSLVFLFSRQKLFFD